jgi:hypothetical protein
MTFAAIEAIDRALACDPRDVQSLIANGYVAGRV